MVCPNQFYFSFNIFFIQYIFKSQIIIIIFIIISTGNVTTVSSTGTLNSLMSMDSQQNLYFAATNTRNIFSFNTNNGKNKDSFLN